jgi:hypothetical protein
VISFITLFLGLALGPQIAELHVDASISSIELQLDGSTVAWIHGPPWVGRFSFGEDLSPHHLVAVGYDGDGKEQDRADQWVNVPRSPAEASILLDQETEGIHRMARVSWESLVESEPSEIRVSFDGQPLSFSDPEAIPLPSYDPEQLHFIRVDLEFGGIVSSKAELIFGGSYADQVNTELTAVPITIMEKKKLPALEEMQSWFSHNGRPLRAAAAEKGPAEVIVVRDLEAWDDLMRIRRTAVSNKNRRTWWFGSTHPAWNKWAFQFFWPVARRRSGTAGMYDLFPPSSKFQAKDGSLHGWVSSVIQPEGLEDKQRLADCVAVAGVTAAGGNRRRAVLLVLGNDPPDASEHSPKMARRYLQQLHVPLFVWSTHPSAATANSGWGDVIDVSTDIKMARATKELFKAVERQRMIWLDGIYLPQEIVLAPEVSSVSFVHFGPKSG